MIQGLFGRLLAVMCAVAAASTGLVLLLQQRSLTRDLESAAERRLDAATTAAAHLLEGHLETMAERYRVVSRTPQFRATLEVDDRPTLTHYAETLLAQHEAARIAFIDAEGRELAAAGQASLAEPAPTAGRGVLAHEGRAFAFVSTPLRDAGRLLAVEEIGDETLAAWSQLCGADVRFDDPARRSDGQIQRSVLRLDGLELRVASSLEAEQAAMSNARWNLAMAGAVGLALAFAVSFFVSRNLVRPIQVLQSAARDIGGGDLTTRVAIDRADEIGDVARAFAAMTESLRATIQRVAEAADRVDGTAGAISQGTKRFAAVAREQERNDAEVAANLEEIEERVQVIAKSAGQSAHGLDQAIDGSTASFRELSESGDVLVENATRLGTQMDEITASMAQMASSAIRVAGDTDALLPIVEATADGVAEVATAAKSVSAHAEETARLSGRVIETAEGGRRVVRDAVAGMESTRETIEESERVIRSLRQRAEEIGAILEVIDDVTNETGLLALNASIIASQAGESGKAFSVVANEMKALANRVQASTHEINQVVRSVQSESEDAVESVGRGSARAREGSARIQQAEISLAEITNAARESGSRMAESAELTAQQMTAAAAVYEQMEAVREGVDRIRAATRDQVAVNERVEQSADALHATAHVVQATVATQTQGAARIGETVEAVQRGVRDITRGLAEQASNSHQVAEVVRRSAQYTRSHETSAADMDAAAADLEQQAELLREAIRRFRI